MSDTTRSMWKFELALEDGVQVINMPLATEVRHVGMQGNKVCLWVETWPGNSERRRGFRIFGTGHDIADARLKYVGTAHQPIYREVHGSKMPVGELVWHVFEQTGLPQGDGVVW